MRHLRGAALLAAVILAILATNSAQGQDACAQLLEADKSTWWDKFLEWVKATEPPAQLDPQTLYFSVRSGFALTPRCDASKPSRRYQQLLYYPVGLIMAKALPESLSIGVEPYDYVITEYGIRMLVPSADIRPIEKSSAGYLFVNSGHTIPYCSDRNCEDPTKAVNTKLHLSPGGGSKRIGRYGQVVNTHNENGRCTWYEFYPSELGTALTTDTTYLYDCWEGLIRGPMRIKFVDHDRAAKFFKYDVRGSVGSFTERHFREAKIDMLNSKACNVEAEYGAKGTAKAGGKYYIFSAEFETYVTRKVVRPLHDFYYFSHYFYNDSQYGIESHSSCTDRDEPTTPRSIRIYNAEMDDDYVSVGIQSIVNKFKELFDLGGYRSTSPNLYRRGKFFVICDPTNILIFVILYEIS
jgi:hypothetical protein